MASDRDPKSARDVLATMWASRRAEAEADLTVLTTLLASLDRSPDDAHIRTQAQRLAHQLVGAFGVFGFADLKDQMAIVDRELVDASSPVPPLIETARAIRAALP